MAGSVAFLSLAASSLRTKRPDAKKPVVGSPPHRPDLLSRVSSTPDSSTSTKFTATSLTLSSAMPNSLEPLSSSSKNNSTPIAIPRTQSHASPTPSFAPTSVTRQDGNRPRSDGHKDAAPRKVYYFDNPRFLPQ